MPAPLFLSWSALRSWEHCKQQEHLRRTKKVGQAQNVRNYVHGSIADRIVRRFLVEDPPELQYPGRMMEYAPEMFERGVTPESQGGEADGVVRWRSSSDRNMLRNFVFEMVRRCEEFLFQDVLPYDYDYGIRFRQPCTIPYLDGSPASIQLVGEIDLLVNRPDGWHGVDLKGTANKDYHKQVLGQLVFYDLACYSMLGNFCQSWGLWQPMVEDGPSFMPVLIGDDEHQQLLSRLTKFAHSRWTNDHPPKDNTKGCNDCEVKHACERYAVSLDDNGRRRVQL